MVIKRLNSLASLSAPGDNKETAQGIDSWRAKLRQALPPLLVFLLGLVLSLALFFVSRGWEQDKAVELFMIEGNRQLTGLNLGVDSFRPDNEAVLSFMQLSPNATYQDFEHFAKQQLAASPRKAAWAGLSYLPALRNEQRDAFETLACNLFCEVTGKNYSTMYISASGKPEIAKARYFPVFYIYPLETNRGAILFDISSSAARNITINAAISSGEMRATPRITLVQENANSYGMLILRPIQKLLTNATDGEITILPDEADLQGLTSGVVRIKDLVDVVSTETRTKSMQLYIFDISATECLSCGVNLVFQEGGCPTCTADFMHAVAFNSEADLAWSKGFVVLENSTTVPEFTLEEVQEMAARSSLVFVQQVDVYGRTWSMTMIGMETEWVQTVSPWMLFGMMLLATVIVTLLMISVVRQHNVMASLQRKDIARLKVITQQQQKDRAIFAASEIKNLMKAFTPTKYPDGSKKEVSTIRTAKLAKALSTAHYLAVACVRICHHSEIARLGDKKVVRSMLHVLSDTYQELLLRNSGHDVSTADQMGKGGLMAVFDSAMHACAFIMQLSKKLAETDWPIEILKLPHCGVGPPMGAATRQRGPRISAAIHWDENSNWGSDATGKLYFTGMPTLVAAEVANAACAAQVLVTKPAANELIGRTELAGFPHMTPLGRYHLKSSRRKQPVIISQLQPAPWDMLHPGIATPGHVEGLDRVGRCPHNLVAHPHPSAVKLAESAGLPKIGDKAKSAAGGSATRAMVSLTVVIMQCPVLMKGSPPEDVLARVEDLVEAMAQTYCGYLVPYTGSQWQLPKVVFMTPVNAVCFCSALQLALLHAPWELEDQKYQDRAQLTVTGRAVFQGPRVSMLIAHLPSGSYKWAACVQKSRTRGQLQGAGLAPQGNSTDPASSASSFSDHRPYVMLSDDASKNMIIRSAELDNAEKVLLFVSPGQIILLGDAARLMTENMPDDTRPIDLGTYALVKFLQPVQLVEVQVRQLQEREFPPPPQNLKTTPGYYDAPPCDDGIAYLMCKIKPPATADRAYIEALSEWLLLARSLLQLFNGYECQCSPDGALNAAFPTTERALNFAATAQRRLMDSEAAKAVAYLPECEEVLAEDGTLLFRGLRVKMGLTFGVPQGKRPSAIGRADYQGPMLSTAAACVTVASPGQVLLGGEAPHNAEGQPQEVALDEPGRRPIDVAALGQFRLRGVDAYTPLFSVSHPDLVGRSFSKPPGQVVISGSAESDTGGTVWDAEQHGTQCEQDAAVANSFANAVQEAMASKTTKYRADESVEIQQIIGMGSFGKVYKGLWKGVTVAYKLVQYPASSMSSKDKFQTTAVMETAISASMSHPHIVQTYSYNIKPIYAKGAQQSKSTKSDNGTADSTWGNKGTGDGFTRPKETVSSAESGQEEGAGQPSILVWEVQIIQEFCDRGSLRNVLTDTELVNSSTGRLEPSTVLKLAGDVARGMLHIHSMQIVHGDLKAPNILVTGDISLTAKVADFGLSVRMEQDQTHVSGMHAGTLTHMAPEILTSGRLSKGADVYAFGILMFEMQTGQKAFKGVPMHQLTTDVCSKMRRPVFPPDAPLKWVELATRCWDHNAEARPTFAEVVHLIDAMKEAHKTGDFAPEGSASPAVTEGLMMSIRKGNVAAIAEGEEGEEEEEMSQMSDYDYSGTIDVAGMGKREAQGLYNGM